MQNILIDFVTFSLKFDLYLAFFPYLEIDLIAKFGLFTFVTWQP
jgi:hypothetical protein